MHQTVITKGKTGSWTLYVAGGKSTNVNWHNTMWSLDLLPYFKTGLKKTKEDGTVEALTSDWEVCKPMASARSNFAMIALKHFIYVYGGISGSGTADKSHHPVLAEATIECYTIASDSWETIKVAMAPRLAAFSWCQMGDTAQIAIVGGTNGSIMSDETHIVDLEAGQVQTSSFDYNTCMGKMCFRESKNTLYHLGGMNSEGIDYEVTLNDADRKWKEIDKNHSLVLNAVRLELCNNSSVYFH